MKKKFKVESLKLKVIITLLCLSLVTFNFSPVTCDAKVYIDITSPAVKKLPIAIQAVEGSEGKTISDIIMNDLDFTGLLTFIDKAMHIEKPSQSFNPDNWNVIGAEAVIKTSVTVEQGMISAAAALYDVFEGREIFKKEYSGGRGSARQIAHMISNDIYRHITGQNGVFHTKVAFVAEDEGKKGLYIMDWDGAGIKRLGIKGDFVLRPHWSKDGTRLVYSSERNRQWGIYLLDFRKMTEKNIFTSKGLNIAGSFSPEGDAIVFSSSKDETYGLYILKTSDLKPAKITSSRGIDISPALSPDGKQIAFVSDRGGTPQIYIMDKSGYDAKRLTFEGSYNTSPVWSADGTKIAFVGRRSGKNQIFIINPDGTGLIQLTESGNNEDPSFSSDGRFIIFSSDRNGTNGIYAMRANGENQKKITPSWLRAFGPAWAPN